MRSLWGPEGRTGGTTCAPRHAPPCPAAASAPCGARANRLRGRASRLRALLGRGGPPRAAPGSGHSGSGLRRPLGACIFRPGLRATLHTRSRGLGNKDAPSPGRFSILVRSEPVRGRQGQRPGARARPSRDAPGGSRPRWAFCATLFLRARKAFGSFSLTSSFSHTFKSQPKLTFPDLHVGGRISGDPMA